MQLRDDQLVYTASDLTDFLACTHLPMLELPRVRAGEKRGEEDEAALLIAAKGLSHEIRYLEMLRNAGHVVLDLGRAKRAPQEDAEATVRAMASGVTYIYQATFFDGDWLGRADFLQRVETPSAQWAWSYEVIDTKLALTPRPAAIIQLSMYSEHLARVQGVTPKKFHIVLGNGECASYSSDRFMAYYRTLKAAYLSHVDTAPASYPLPVAHCAQCSWSDACESRRAADDHLSLVAWMRRDQIARFAAADITTVAELAAAADEARPVGMAPETFGRLRHQARLQHEARKESAQRGVPVYRYDVLPPQAGIGLAKLPPASPGDVYFDMEGDPLYEADRGLEYLFGNYLPEGTFKMFWALTPADECAAFTACVDFFLERLARDPQMHVYHYAPYEKVALRRLSMQYDSRVEEVDQLLRRGIFIDLYEIVRQGVMISQPSYSIKKLEPFYDFSRKTDVKKGDDSIVAFERWRADQRQVQLLTDIERYNEDDCRSTYALRCWLDRIKQEAEVSYAVTIPWNGAEIHHEEYEVTPESAKSELREAQSNVVNKLHAHGEASDVHRLLAAVIPYHSREAKPIWWEYFDRCNNADSLTEEDGKALGGLVLDVSKPPIKPPGAISKKIYTYSFPAQKFAGEDADMHDAFLRREVGSIEALEFSQDGGVVKLKLNSKVEPEAVRTLIPHKLVSTVAHEWALVGLGEHIGETHTLTHSFATDILQGAAPRLRGFETGAVLQPKTVDGLTISDMIGRLQNSYLIIQGPPGTGKTSKGANAIVHLLSRGLRVGITSRSHAAIDHLLASVDRIAQELGVAYRGVRKPQDEKQTQRYIHTSPNLTTQSKSAKIFADDVQLVAATSWAFVGKDVPSRHFDVVLIDEAGQFSLADTLALHDAAKNVVLLGDPLQLKQVARGQHPLGTDASVLEHMLREHATVPPDRGIFLDLSYRMHPEICTFISENIYEGRLSAAAQTAHHRIDSHLLKGAGLRFKPIAHTGNSRDSSEEAQWICDRIEELLSGTLIDEHRNERDIQASDILIVTPYNAQRSCIERKLKARSLDGIGVGTVDKFQGQEAAIVFYSMASSSGEDLPRDIAFLYERNRFNVAISRAKAMCVLVASPELLRPVCNSLEEMAMVNLLCRYVEEAALVGGITENGTNST